MVNVIKRVESYPKTSRIAVVKEKVVSVAETYKEALDIAYNLNLKNSNPNITFVTGNINKSY